MVGWCDDEGCAGAGGGDFMVESDVAGFQYRCAWCYCIITVATHKDKSARWCEKMDIVELHLKTLP